MAKVVKRPDGCWEWTGMRLKPSRTATRNGSGYGYLWVEGKMVRAHRLSHELFIGPIPLGDLVLHSCDRPWCVAPAHLRAGDHFDNAEDCASRGRQKNGWTKGLSTVDA